MNSNPSTPANKSNSPKFRKAFLIIPLLFLLVQGVLGHWHANLRLKFHHTAEHLFSGKLDSVVSLKKEIRNLDSEKDANRKEYAEYMGKIEFWLNINNGYYPLRDILEKAYDLGYAKIPYKNFTALYKNHTYDKHLAESVYKTASHIAFLDSVYQVQFSSHFQFKKELEKLEPVVDSLLNELNNINQQDSAVRRFLIFE